MNWALVPMKKYFLPILFLLLIACDDESDLPMENGKFEVEVISKQDCNLLLIDFKEKDIPLVSQITEVEGSRYYALQLSKINIVEGQVLIIEFRKMTEAELAACPALAPTYPGIVLLSIRFKS
jgi:hypothetical protein